MQDGSYHHIPSLCIMSTRPAGGGVTSLSRAVAEHARENGLTAELLFPSRSFGDLLRGSRVDAFPCALRHYRSIPYLYALSYWVPAVTARKALRRYDLYQAVGGSALPGIPLWANNLRYTCWIATTLQDEWRARYRWYDLSYRNWPSHLNAPAMPLLRLWEKAVLHGAERVFSVSEYTAKQLRNEIGLSDTQVEVTPYLVDTNLFSPNGEAVDLGCDYIIFCGRSDDRRKNVRLLFEAFALVRKHHPGLKLVITGPRSRDPRIWRPIERLGIRDSVVFLGQVRREMLPAYLRGAKVKVLSSEQEGLGIAVMEAMACGVPVVSTRCGGPEEIVAHGEAGFLVPNHSPQHLSAAILDLLADNDLRTQMGTSSRELIMRRYSLQNVGYRFIARFRELHPELPWHGRAPL